MSKEKAAGVVVCNDPMSSLYPSSFVVYVSLQDILAPFRPVIYALDLTVHVPLPFPLSVVVVY